MEGIAKGLSVLTLPSAPSPPTPTPRLGILLASVHCPVLSARLRTNLTSYALLARLLSLAFGHERLLRSPPPPMGMYSHMPPAGGRCLQVHEASEPCSLDRTHSLQVPQNMVMSTPFRIKESRRGVTGVGWSGLLICGGGEGGTWRYPSPLGIPRAAG